MIFRYQPEFSKDYQRLPDEVRRRVDKALRILAENPFHSSLHTKKMKGLNNVWEARVSRSHRITFNWEGETITFRRVGTHDILKKESS